MIVSYDAGNIIDCLYLAYKPSKRYFLWSCACWQVVPNSPLNITNEEVRAHLESIGMPQDMISKMRPDQKEKMKEIIQSDPKQQAKTTLMRHFESENSISLQEALLHFRRTGEIVPRMKPNRRLRGLGKWQWDA